MTPNLPPKVQPVAKNAVRSIPMQGARTRRILLEEHSDISPGGLYIGHNGNNYTLHPGQWVDAPLPLIEILDHALTQVPEIDPGTKQVIGWREKLRFPYRVAPGQSEAA
jgi:hypothetical protein